MASFLWRLNGMRARAAFNSSADGRIVSGTKRICQGDSNRELGTQPPSATKTVPTEADVVVVGGGSLGCNTLYHLVKNGITNVVLLEAHKLTSGTTWHTAGLLWELKHSDIDTRLIHTTRNLLLRLEEESGVSPGWINNGGLMVAQSKNRLDEYKHLVSLGKAMGIEAYILDPAETKNIHPLMKVDDIVGTIYSPRDGTMDPSGFCTALTRSAKNGGAQVIEDCPVTTIGTAETLLGGKRVTEVHTPYGVIKTSAVVNAAGSWGNYIANMVGTDLPLMIVEHSMIYTERIPGIENTPNVREPSASAVIKLQGDTLAVAGFEKSPILDHKLARDSPFMLYDMKFDVFGEVFEKAANRIPALATSGIKSTICGPESFTPDVKPILGEDPHVEGFYHCCGGNGACMMLGGGLGEQMAKWIVYGRPEVDMFTYDIRRFYGPLKTKRSWVNAKSHECFMHRYSIIYKHDEPLAGRGQRRSPLHETLERQGCVFQERHGWERPGWFNVKPSPVQPYDWYGAYGNPINADQRYCDALKVDHSFELPQHLDLLRKECLTCRDAAAIFDVSDRGKFYLKGSDAETAADWIFSANVNRDPGTAVYTCMLNYRGGVEAVLTVSICEDSEADAARDPSCRSREFYMTTGGTVATHNISHLLREIRIHKWNVQLIDKTDDIVILSLQGPNSIDILQAVSDCDFSHDAFPYSSHQIISVIGHRVFACRLDSTGEIGWELHVAKESAITIYEHLMAAGKSYGIINAGYRALESLSAEMGYRFWPYDVRSDDTPLEANLAFTCKMETNIDFLGRDALEKQEQSKSMEKKKLLTFTLDDPTKALWGNEAILRDGVPVGIIRRADYAFSLGRAIGYGFVQRPNGDIISTDFLKTGVWKIESMAEELNATLHLQHPFDPKHSGISGLHSSN